MKPLNVIVIKADEYRADLLGCLGHPIIRTPNLDALAASGTLFENAFCCSPLCVPSRTSFFMGQYVHRTRSTFFAPDDYIRRNRWSFVNSFKEAGYVTGLVGKNHAFHDDYLEKYFDYREECENHGKTHGQITPRDVAVSNWLHDEKRPGFRFYDGRLMEGLIEGAMPFPREDCVTWRIAEDSCRFIDQNSGTPFFLHASFPEPHWPNVAPEPYYSMYDPNSLTIECEDIDWSTHPFAHYVQSQSCGFDHYTTDERKRILATYYGQITFIDDAIGKIMSKLEEKGLADRTLVVFAADHGCFAGRYGLVGKTKAFYDALLRIPLIMRIPRLKPPRVTADVSNIDVMLTIADHLGLPSSPDSQGLSLLPLLRGECKSLRDAIFAEVGTPEPPPAPMPMSEFPAYNRMRQEKDGIFWFIEYVTRGRAAMIRGDGWKYCYYTGDKEELYDLKSDPMEMRNLADAPEYSSRLMELKNRLLEWLLREPALRKNP